MQNRADSLAASDSENKPNVGCYIHHRHLLLLLSPKADTHLIYDKRSFICVVLSVSDAFIGQHDLDWSHINLTNEVFTTRQRIVQTKLGLMPHLNELLKRCSLNPAHIKSFC